MKTKIKVKKKVIPYQKAADAFLKGATSGQFKSYAIVNGQLVNDTIIESKEYVNEKERMTMLFNLDATGVIAIANKEEIKARIAYDQNESTVFFMHKIREVIAKRQPDGTIIVNSSQLQYTGSNVAFGRRQAKRGASPVQQYLIDKKCIAVPFIAFEQAKLDINKLVIVDRGKEETVKEKYSEYNAKTKRYNTKYRERHFTGATLFAIDDSRFLFDLDRREVEHGIINPFIVELPLEFQGVSSITDAYNCLVPKEVKTALAKGLNVQRQGEWFFIQTNEEGKPDKGEIRWNNSDPGLKRMELRAGPNRPNYASQCIEEKQLVRGMVTHSGREHEPLDLGTNTWFKPVPNTASRSFTITGDVD